MREEIGKKKILIFFDWMSLYQNHGGPPRTPEQDELFGLGLRDEGLCAARRLFMTATPRVFHSVSRL